MFCWQSLTTFLNHSSGENKNRSLLHSKRRKRLFYVSLLQFSLSRSYAFIILFLYSTYFSIFIFVGVCANEM